MMMDWAGCSGGGKAATFSCIPVLLQVIISWALSFAGAVALIFIIYAGIRFIFSGGDPKSVEGAKKILTYAIAGLILILISFAIIYMIADATGATCIKTFGFGCT